MHRQDWLAGSDVGQQCLASGCIVRSWQAGSGMDDQQVGIVDGGQFATIRHPHVDLQIGFFQRRLQQRRCRSIIVPGIEFGLFRGNQNCVRLHIHFLQAIGRPPRRCQACELLKTMRRSALS